MSIKEDTLNHPTEIQQKSHSAQSTFNKDIRE